MERQDDSPVEASEGLDRVITIPNAITALRLLLVPVFVWLLFWHNRPVDASVLLGILGATDWVDGYLARRLGQVSTLGKIIDPVADRVLVATGVMSIIVYGAVPVWFGVVTLVREAVVSLAVLLLATLGAERIDVLWVGKAGTFGVMLAYPAFLLSYGSAGWQEPFRVVAWVSGIGGLALGWYAVGAYVPAARRALQKGRAGRAGNTGAG